MVFLWFPLIPLMTLQRSSSVRRRECYGNQRKTIENLVKNRFEAERVLWPDSIRFLTAWLTSLRPRETGFAISRCQASFWSVSWSGHSYRGGGLFHQQSHRKHVYWPPQPRLGLGPAFFFHDFFTFGWKNTKMQENQRKCLKSINFQVC